MAAYTLVAYASPPTVTLTRANDRVYFGGKLIRGDSGQWADPDRLGSVGTYFPYGENRNGGGSMFATYTRDGSGLDYAANRYYWSNLGRFTSPDPYKASAGSADPASWNRYAYVEADPVNAVDPDGAYLIAPDYLGWAPIVNPWCSVEAFTGLRNLLCNVPALPALFAPEPPVDPNCGIELHYRPVSGTGQNHAYLYVLVEDRGYILEGEPEKDPSVLEILSKPNAWGHLISVSTPGMHGDPKHKGDDAANDSGSGAVYGGKEICDLVRRLSSRAKSFNASHPGTFYSPLGPNSNSYAYWQVSFITDSLKALPEYSDETLFTRPADVIGWGIAP